jgi:diguanylate cyclase (GGDEF)-like protein
MNLLEALQPFTTQKLTIENLEKAVRSDDKTPLLNFLALTEASETFGKTADSSNVVIFADIDNLKTINTEHGYEGGDAAVREVGKSIHTNLVNENTKGFHISGDEFVLLTKESALNDFKKSTVMFEKWDITLNEKVFSTRLSFGIAINDNKSDFQRLQDRAELACKYAKNQKDQRYAEWTSDLERQPLTDLRKSCRNCDITIRCDIPVAKKESMRINVCPICIQPLTDA